MCEATDENLPPKASSARCLAIATLILGAVSISGFTLWPYFPAISGLLAIIGCSIVLCGNAANPCSHRACSILCIIAAIGHLLGFGLWMYYYIYVVVLVDKASSDSGSEVSTGVVAYWVGIVVWPVLVVSLVCFILEVCQAVMCQQARTQLLLGELPSSTTTSTYTGQNNPLQNDSSISPMVVTATPAMHVSTGMEPIAHGTLINTK